MAITRTTTEQPGKSDPGARIALRKESTTPRWLRFGTAVALLALAGLFVVTSIAIGHAREGLKVIGHDAGPQVVATADLYFALSDMDAQVAEVLLIGRDEHLGIGRDKALRRYEQRRAEASRALLQAAELSGSDPIERRTVQAVLEGLGRYERLASEAMLLDSQSGHPAGQPPAPVVAKYRQATDLMKLELLPKAYNLTLDSGSIVRRTHESTSSGILGGRRRITGVGLAAVALLVAMQLFMAGRFRRILNPALVLATVLTIGLVVASMQLLTSQADTLRTAKQDGFDAILSMSRARAISNSMYADESRYLLDPGRADTYEQVYLEKSQTILYVPSGNLEKYFDGLDSAVGEYRSGSRPEFLGLFGDAAEDVSLAAERPALIEALGSYDRFQDTDRRMRSLVTDNSRRDAIELRMGPSIEAFDAYDKSVVKLIDVHENAFDSSIDESDRGLSGWNVGLPVVVVLIMLLVLAGVRPRLAEYH